MIKLGLQFFGNGNSGAKGAGMSGGGGKAVPASYMQFNMAEDVDNVLGSETERWRKKIGKTKQDNIYDYTGKGYRDINKLLRGTKEFSDEERFELEHKIDSISQSIEKFNLNQNIQVYRAMDVDIAEVFGTADANELAKGYIFTEKAFSSTTAVKGSNWFFDGNVSLTINVPKGQGHGAWVKPISRVKSENEFLLNKGASYKFTSAHYEGSTLVVECDFIGYAENI